MIVLVAYFSVKPENLDRVLDLCRQLVEQTRREPGCLTYVAHQRLDDPLQFCFYEAYQDEQAIEAHRASLHYAQLVTNGLFRLIENPTRQRYQPLAADSRRNSC
jgi:quinol monooxygenase YgiN